MNCPHCSNIITEQPTVIEPTPLPTRFNIIITQKRHLTGPAAAAANRSYSVVPLWEGTGDDFRRLLDSATELLFTQMRNDFSLIRIRVCICVSSGYTPLFSAEGAGLENTAQLARRKYSCLYSRY